MAQIRSREQRRGTRAERRSAASGIAQDRGEHVSAAPGSAETDDGGDGTQTDPPGGKNGGSSGAPPNSSVNKQILDAVQASTEYAFGLNNQLQTSSGKDRLSAGVAIAYDKAAQAAALGVQDATDYERNVLSIASAAQGKALAMILAGDNVGDAAVAFVLALISSVVAPIVVLEVGEAQTKMLGSFPQA